ncbi:hypothetical protein FNV43_RR16835 [Rhamnella rubrinervis]|uniref:Inositol polyphosphate-related phosphatase domain-containing protein n=1 Tax=Rhamnella rubrinervis TaxID=2594499 RepID=A0A8K0GZI1_9ROSA|nr:hypothetical protein FNV43_RR16835 [Rhamnella rubrinervis]
MRTERGKISKSSWPKVVARKWLNIQSGADEFHSDYALRKDKTERRKSCSDEDCYVVVPEDFAEGWLMAAKQRPSFGLEAAAVNDTQNLRMFVGTWNVGGKSPHEGLNLKEWLSSPAPADIYVLGFQEIVPLNAGNVLGAEDKGPAAKWLNLIREALNNNDHGVPSYSYNASNVEFAPQPQLFTDQQQTSAKPRVSFSDLLSLKDELGGDDFQRFMNLNPTLISSSEEGSPSSPLFSSRKQGNPRQQQSRYCLAASKQMVGIFLCVWVRADLYKHISNMKVSCVGRGIMGYLGNKGSISISMTLHQTSFCFVCTHLTSGEKEGDEVRRNLDVMEILKRTRFSHCRDSGQEVPPDSILEHDKVIWLGDLNYRLAASCGDTHELLKKRDWQTLLEKDQLRIEQRAGRVFRGWEEGGIYFAPTYKYLANSDNYVAQTSKSREKQRTPAWCDRILWKGEGMKQMWYVRGESKFSDHRPVYSLFSVQIDLLANKNKNKPTPTITSNKKTTTTNTITTRSCLLRTSANTGLPTSCVAKVQAEELLLLTRAQSCINSHPRF